MASKRIYDYKHDGGCPKRIYPKPPPPPIWSWGPSDLLLKSSQTDQEDLPEGKSDDEEEELPPQRYAIDKSNENRCVLDYDHGEVEREMSRKYLVNPLYKKRSSAQIPNSPASPTYDEQNNDNDCMQPVNSTNSNSSDAVEPITAEKNEKARPKIIKKPFTNKRKINNPDTSDLSLIGQKLNKTRVPAGSYAKPTKNRQKNDKSSIEMENNTATTVVTNSSCSAELQLSKEGPPEDVVVKIDPFDLLDTQCPTDTGEPEVYFWDKIQQDLRNQS